MTRANKPAAQRGEPMKIMASREATTHPHMAVAAARDGLTLAQFRAMVAGAAPRRGGSALAKRAADRVEREGGR